MPIRRLNYTGRKRIRQSDVRITVHQRGNGTATFDADLKLAGYALPENAIVFVEAQRQTSYMRFPFGTVGDLQPAVIRELSEFDSPEGVVFRVKITSTDQPNGLLLAAADGIRPRRPEEKEDKRIPLLPAKQNDDLGDQVFRVDFIDHPILLINAQLGDWRAVARDPVFVSLVYPGAMREILARILHEGHRDTDDSEDWRSQWLRFAGLLPGVPELPADDDQEMFDDWVEEAVSSFCRQFRMIDRFGEYWTREGAS